MRPGQRVHPPGHRRGIGLGVIRWRQPQRGLHHGQSVLRAVVHLPHQQGLTVLGLLPLGDVDVHAEKAVGLPARAADAPGAAEQPARRGFLALPPQHAELALQLAGDDRGLREGQKPRPVIRVHHRHEAVEARAGVLGGIQPEQRKDLGRPHHLSGGGVPFPGANAGRFLRQAQPRLALAQRLLGGLPLRHVRCHGNGAHQAPRRVPHGGG